MVFSLLHLPRRLTAAREKADLTQEALSKKIGLKDRQTLASMESGQRKVTVEELLAIITATGQPMEFFTDPFLLAGEGNFSYRASGVHVEELDEFERRAGGWIAAWRYLGEKRNELPGPLIQRLDLKKDSSFEEAQRAGEAVASALKLGAVPAEKLTAALEEHFKLLILHVDMPAGVSGAACQVTNGDTILINRREPEGRRNFDLAHELFHVLTWDAMPPERVDRKNPSGNQQKRTEQLADNFAGALLMPAEALKVLWERRQEADGLEHWLAAAARHFHVSGEALKWRLAALGLISKREAERLTPPRAPVAGETPPPLFSRRFMDRLAWAGEHGEMSVRRMVEVTGVSLADLKELFPAYGLTFSIGI